MMSESPLRFCCTWCTTVHTCTLLDTALSYLALATSLDLDRLAVGLVAVGLFAGFGLLPVFCGVFFVSPAAACTELLIM